MLRGLKKTSAQEILRFDEDAHRYTFPGGSVLPGVTTILKSERVQTYGEGDATFPMMVGSWAHKAIMLHLEGTLDREGLSPGMEDYLRSFEQWADAFRISASDSMAVEERLYHPVYVYAGTIDLLVPIRYAGVPDGPKVWTMVDFKTGSFRKGDRVQVAAYGELAREGFMIPDKKLGKEVGWTIPNELCGMVVYLSSTGGFPKVEFLDAPAMKKELQIFLAANVLYRWKEVAR